MSNQNSFGAAATLRGGDRSYRIYRLDALGDVSRLPFSIKILLENLLRHEDGADRQGRRHRVRGPVERPARLRARSASCRPACCSRTSPAFRWWWTWPPCATRCRRWAPTLPAPIPLLPVRPGHRPLRAGGPVRLAGRLPVQRPDRVRAQPRALCLPALGAVGFPEFPRGPAGHRHRPPGQPGIPGARSYSARKRTARPRLTPTRWSAPIRTPP